MNNYKLVTGGGLLERCANDCEKLVITHALARTKGNQSAAAKLLGTTRRILCYKNQKYGLNEYNSDKY